MSEQPTPAGLPAAALDKWARTYLSERPTPEGRHFVYRYDASHCRDGGGALPLAFHVRLDGVDAGAAIGAAWIDLPPEVELQRFCGWSARGRDWLDQVRRPPGCVGKTLAAALAVGDGTDPAGCICNEAQRLHKWRNVLATIAWQLGREG